MGDFTDQQVNQQQYQTSGEFYGAGGQFEQSHAPLPSSDTDDINRELDELLGGAPDDEGGQGGQGGAAPDSNRLFAELLREQRQQREADSIRHRQQQELETKARQQQETENKAKQLREQAAQRALAYQPQFNEVQLTDEQRAAYAGSDPYIQSVVQAQVKKLWEDSLAPALTDHQQSLLELSSRPTQTSISIEERVALARPDINQIANSPEFQRYLAEPVEGTGMTYRDIMAVAYQQNNVNAVISMVDSFNNSKNKHAPKRSATPTGSLNSAPTGGNGGSPKARNYSELATAHADFRRGLITPEKMQKIENLFENLAQQGLVNMDK